MIAKSDRCAKTSTAYKQVLKEIFFPPRKQANFIPKEGPFPPFLGSRFVSKLIQLYCTKPNDLAKVVLEFGELSRRWQVRGDAKMAVVPSSEPLAPRPLPGQD